MKFWSRSYRLFLFFRRYLRLRDVLQLVMGAAAAVLAYNSLSVRPGLATGAAITYGLAWVSFVVVSVRQRQARDFLEGEILWGLFDQLNEDVFASDHRTRFTLFRRAPLRPNKFIALYRYKKGGRGAIPEAEESRTHYDQAAGMAGRAWLEPGTLFFKPIPAFASRSECVEWHVTKLGIQREVAECFSPYVEQVRCIFSYGLLDRRNQILGVVTLDLCAPVSRQTVQGDDTGNSHVFLSSLGTDNDEPHVIDTATIVRLLKSTQSVLESF